MEVSKSALESLIVSQEEIATDVVAKALQGLISLIRETGEVLPSPAFGKLDNNRKILAYMLGLRACLLLKLGNGKKVEATPDEIADILGVTPQRAREYLSRMKGKFLQKTAEGWQLPPSRIPLACDELINR